MNQNFLTFILMKKIKGENSMINDDEINEFSPAEGGDDSVKEFNPYSEFLNDDEPSETSVASETGGEEHLTTESDIELPDFLRTRKL